MSDQPNPAPLAKWPCPYCGLTTYDGTWGEHVNAHQQAALADLNKLKAAAKSPSK